MLKIDFENQILALFDIYFWPFNKSHEKINTIFVISAIIASIWNVFIKLTWWKTYSKLLQVNLFQKHSFLNQLTHNMTTDCSLNYKFNTWKFQAQTWGEHVVYRNCFWHSEQFLYTTCSPHVLQKEELLTKIYLYLNQKVVFELFLVHIIVPLDCPGVGSCRSSTGYAAHRF